MRDVSIPVVGSVTPKAISNSPLASLGRNSRFIASLP
jgi:hypothetical protein